MAHVMRGVRHPAAPSARPSATGRSPLVIREEIPLTDFATLGLSPALLEVLAAEGAVDGTAPRA